MRLGTILSAAAIALFGVADTSADESDARHPGGAVAFPPLPDIATPAIVQAQQTDPLQGPTAKPKTETPPPPFGPGVFAAPTFPGSARVPNNEPDPLLGRRRRNSNVAYTPHMLGNLFGYYGTATLFADTSLSDTIPDFARTRDQLQVKFPILSRGAFSIAENESPRPNDRVFATFNYFNQPALSVRPLGSSLTLQPNANAFPFFGPGPFPLRPTFFDTLLNTPGVRQTSLNDFAVTSAAMYRGTFGFEQTFLDESMSFGMRVPIYATPTGFAATPNADRLDLFQGPSITTAQVIGTSGGVSGGAIGDITLIAKFAFWDDPETGILLSGGLATTLPTGQAVTFGDELKPASVLLQPWLGYIYAKDRWYVHGFSAAVTSTYSQEPTFLTNDIGVGYNILECDNGRFLRVITPTLEAHVTTPLTHRNPADTFSMPDQVVITAGAHFLLGDATSLTVGAAVPLTGAKPFQYEGIVQLNWFGASPFTNDRTASGNGSDSARNPCGPPGRTWFGAEYLLWTNRGNALPPLLTTAPAGTPLAVAGTIGDPSTRVLLGGNNANNDWRSGLRIDGGRWFNEEQTRGIEAGLFFLGQSDYSATIGSDGSQILTRPFTDNVRADALGNFNEVAPFQNTELVSFPGVLAGSATVSSSTDLLGFGANFIRNLDCTPIARLDWLLGYRFLFLKDSLTIQENLTGLAGSAFPGVQFLVTDSFKTRNYFNGVNGGFNYERRMGRLYIGVRTTLALGVTHSVANIDGSTRLSDPNGTVTTLQGGLLALPSNIGQYASDNFSVVPEVGLKLGMQVSDHVRVSAGYNYLYWSNVLRTGGVIDTRVNASQLPPSGGVIGPAYPRYEPSRTNFATHGITAGLEFLY